MFRFNRIAAAWLTVLATAGPGAAQVRVGLVLGGTSPISVVAEYRRNHTGVEVQAGSLGFRQDVSVAVTAKQYIGANALEPYVGVGLWVIAARTRRGTGAGLIARIPVGIDWTFVSEHAVGTALHFNRALAVRRPDPTDRRPPRPIWVPLPEIGYRWSATDP